MMKAKQYDRRILSRGLTPNVFSIQESASIERRHLQYLGSTLSEKEKEIAIQQITDLLNDFADAKEYGSIIKANKYDWQLLKEFASYSSVKQLSDETIGIDDTQIRLFELIATDEVLSRKYWVTCTNPPYMEISSGTNKLVNYVNDNYIGGKTDMFAVFIERAALFTKATGFVGMITQPSLTSLVSFEKLRRKLFAEKSFYNVLHMGRGIFGIDFGSFSFVFRNIHVSDYLGHYFRLYDRTFQYINPDDIKRLFLLAKNDDNFKADFEQYDTTSGVSKLYSSNGNKLSYYAKQDNFLLVPGIPFAYTMSEQMIKAYSDGLLGESFLTREGMATAGNDDFLRMWYEVDINSIGFGCVDSTMALKSGKKWFPYNKGGDYRKWYGNNDYVVDWENDGERIKNNRDEKTGRIRSHNYNGDFAFRNGLTWSSISAGDISIRWSDTGFLFDSKGAKGFANNPQKLYSIMGFLNSSVAMKYLKVISPTMDFKVGDIAQLPLNKAVFENDELIELVKRNIEIMKNDWDSVETSWDFDFLPHLNGTRVKEYVEARIMKRAANRSELRHNEERINRIIADTYGYS